MCLTMVFNHFVLGIVIGMVGIVVLLMLIPLTKGIHDGLHQSPSRTLV